MTSVAVGWRVVFTWLARVPKDFVCDGASACVTGELVVAS